MENAFPSKRSLPRVSIMQKDLGQRISYHNTRSSNPDTTHQLRIRQTQCVSRRGFWSKTAVLSDDVSSSRGCCGHCDSSHIISQRQILAPAVTVVVLPRYYIIEILMVKGMKRYHPPPEVSSFPFSAKSSHHAYVI